MVGLIPNQHSNSGLTPRDRPAIYCICVGLVQQHSMHSEPHVYPASGRGPVLSLLVMYTVHVSVYAAPSGLCSSPCMQFGGQEAPVFGQPVERHARDSGPPPSPRELGMVMSVSTAPLSLQRFVVKVFRSEQTPHSNRGFLGFSGNTSLVQCLLDGMPGVCRDYHAPLNWIPSPTL